MWYPAAITTPATAEPVTLAQAKEQCRIDDADSDWLLNRLITAARNHVEKYCATRFASQTVTVKCDCFADMARLSEAPVTSITSISYVDTAGATQVLATSVYELRADGIEAAVVLKYNQTWPAIQPGSRITVVAVVGHAAAPEAVVHAMLLLIGHWMENREAVSVGETSSAIDMMVDALLCNHRRGV
jgi:uncharacterized phiE125 gp8 family phage protein